MFGRRGILKALITELRPYQSRIVGIAVLLSFVGLVFKDGSITSIVGLFLTVPLQLLVLRQENSESDLFSRESIVINILRYALIAFFLWIISINLGPLVLALFIPTDMSSSQLMYFPSFALLSLLIGWASPYLYKVATGQLGQRLLIWDMVKIYLIWTGYVFLRVAAGSLTDLNKGFYLLATPIAYYGLILAFCLQTVVILQRNQRGRAGW